MTLQVQSGLAGRTGFGSCHEGTSTVCFGGSMTKSECWNAVCLKVARAED